MEPESVLSTYDKFILSRENMALWLLGTAVITEKYALANGAGIDYNIRRNTIRWKNEKRRLN